jgi:hypothetical protein
MGESARIINEFRENAVIMKLWYKYILKDKNKRAGAMSIKKYFNLSLNIYIINITL